MTPIYKSLEEYKNDMVVSFGNSILKLNTEGAPYIYEPKKKNKIFLKDLYISDRHINKYC